MKDMTDDELQAYYEKYKHYQAGVIQHSLNLKDLINLIRTVDISEEIEEIEDEQ